MLELGKQLLIKDNLLDTEAADREAQRHTQFLDKLEHVESGVDDLQTRLARLVAERASAQLKLQRRLDKLDKLEQFHQQQLLEQMNKESGPPTEASPPTT